LLAFEAWESSFAIAKGQDYQGPVLFQLEVSSRPWLFAAD